LEFIDLGLAAALQAKIPAYRIINFMAGRGFEKVGGSNTRSQRAETIISVSVATGGRLPSDYIIYKTGRIFRVETQFGNGNVRPVEMRKGNNNEKNTT
jgi:hypothetical protein